MFLYGVSLRSRRSRASATFLFLSLLILGVSLVACHAEPRGTLTIINITDLHGALLSEDKDPATGKRIGGAAVLASYIEAEKARAIRATAGERESVRAETGGDEVILLACGDMMQGSAISNLSRGEAIIEFMNAVGVEACALGNHEFDWGIDVLGERIGQARFPFLAANLFLGEGTKRPEWIAPYTVVKKGNIKIGIIGVITPDAPVIVNPANLRGIRFEAPETAVNQLSAELRKEGVRVIIVLAHIGGGQEKDGTITGPIAALAKRLTGVDAIIGGHSHTVVAGEVSSIPVVISGANGHRLGVTRLEIGSDGRASLLEQYIVPAFGDEVEPDKNVVAIVESYGKKFAGETDRVVAVASAKIETERLESPLGNLISDIMREAVGAQAAFQNSGGIRADFAEGPITVGDIYKCLPFDNTIVTMYLTGEQIREVLEQGTTARGVVQTSGLRFSCRPEDPPGQRVKSIWLENGTPVSATEVYLVATNDFMANGGDRFKTFGQGKEIRNTQILLRDAVISWMEVAGRAEGSIAPPKLGRVEILNQ